MLIECTNGPTLQKVGDHSYSFQRDEHARFVAEVFDLRHVQILLAVEHYRQVSDRPAVDADTTTFTEAHVSEMAAKHQVELEALALQHAKALTARDEVHATELQKARDEGRAEALELLAKEETDKPQTIEGAADPAPKTQKKVSK